MSNENKNLDIEYLINIANSFDHQGNIKNIQSLGTGNINDTFLVRKNEAKDCCFI